jgi:hypothetical protein
LSPAITTIVALLALAAPAWAAPTPAQLCESAIELASAKYAQCRLNAESRFSKSLDAGKRTDTLARCSQNLTIAFARANYKYGVNCAVTESSSAFDEYLTQCSDDATAAAAGAALPDYVGDLASCNADMTSCNGDLTTCNGDLTTCTTNLGTAEADLTACEGDLSTCNGDLTACEGDLVACEAAPTAQLLKTGQTTSYGAGTDGDLELGVAQNYVDNGDGTITDTQTGLMWEKKSDDGTIHDKDNTYYWTAGPPGDLGATGTAFTSFIATINGLGGFAGHTDWRLPNRRELESLVDIATHNPAVFPAFNTGCGSGCTVLACSCTAALNYWSSSSGAYSPSGAWVVNFNGGLYDFDSKAMPFCVRAVRGGS